MAPHTHRLTSVTQRLAASAPPPGISGWHSLTRAPRGWTPRGVLPRQSQHICRGPGRASSSEHFRDPASPGGSRIPRSELGRGDGTFAIGSVAHLPSTAASTSAYLPRWLAVITPQFPATFAETCRTCTKPKRASPGHIQHVCRTGMVAAGFARHGEGDRGGSVHRKRSRSHRFVGAGSRHKRSLRSDCRRTIFAGTDPGVGRGSKTVFTGQPVPEQACSGGSRQGEKAGLLDRSPRAPRHVCRSCPRPLGREHARARQDLPSWLTELNMRPSKVCRGSQDVRHTPRQQGLPRRPSKFAEQ